MPCSSCDDYILQPLVRSRPLSRTANSAVHPSLVRFSAPHFRLCPPQSDGATLQLQVGYYHVDFHKNRGYIRCMCIFRALMFAWMGAFIGMVTINLLMSLFDLAAGHYNPQKISETGEFFFAKKDRDFDVRGNFWDDSTVFFAELFCSEWGPYLYTGHGMTHAFSSVQVFVIVT